MGADVIPLSLPLALCLIASPDAPPAPCRLLAPYLCSAALALELMDPRETKYLFIYRAIESQSDLATIRTRWQELKDAPPVADAARFPHRQLVRAWLNFNRAFRAHIEARQEMEPLSQWTLREAVIDCNRLYDFWDTVADASTPHYYLTVRRRCLLKLRDLLGPEAYYAGVLPEIVPMWATRRMD